MNVCLYVNKQILFVNRFLQFAVNIYYLSLLAMSQSKQEFQQVLIIY